MIKTGYNVAGEPRFVLPAACNRLHTDRVMITDKLQYDLSWCNQFAGERVLWLTRWSNPLSMLSWFHPNGRTQVNWFNEEEWWDKSYTSERGLKNLTLGLERTLQVDPTAIISVQIGVQDHAIGYAPRVGGEEWFTPIWNGLPPSLRAHIAFFNVHFYAGNGDVDIDPVLDFLMAVRLGMDKMGAKNVGIRIGEIGLDRSLVLENQQRANTYPARLVRKLSNQNQKLGLGIEDIFFYCAGAYPNPDADSRYMSLVEFGQDALTPYGESFAKLKPI